MNICELSAASTNTNLVTKHDIFMHLQQNGYKVEAVHNSTTGKFDQNLVVVEDFLCFLLPMDNSPRIINDSLLESTDFIIATTQIGDLVSYYIIPSDDIIENKASYPLEYAHYKDRWDLFNL